MASVHSDEARLLSYQTTICYYEEGVASVPVDKVPVSGKEVWLLCCRNSFLWKTYGFSAGQFCFSFASVLLFEGFVTSMFPWRRHCPSAVMSFGKRCGLSPCLSQSRCGPLTCWLGALSALSGPKKKSWPLYLLVRCGLCFVRSYDGGMASVTVIFVPDHDWMVSYSSVLTQYWIQKKESSCIVPCFAFSNKSVIYQMIDYISQKELPIILTQTENWIHKRTEMKVCLDFFDASVYIVYMKHSSTCLEDGEIAHLHF